MAVCMYGKMVECSKAMVGRDRIMMPGSLKLSRNFLEGTTLVLGRSCPQYDSRYVTARGRCTFSCFPS